jgi:hypothetical protein
VLPDLYIYMYVFMYVKHCNKYCLIIFFLVNSHVIKLHSQFNNTVGTGSIFIGSLSTAAVTEALQYREALEPSVTGCSTYLISYSCCLQFLNGLAPS